MAQRNVLVTGGMGGLGETICTKMADAGYTVTVTYSPGNTKALDWLANMKARLQFPCLPGDVASFESCTEAAKRFS
jgi:acetoacetyl-CoA reductase